MESKPERNDRLEAQFSTVTDKFEAAKATLAADTPSRFERTVNWLWKVVLCLAVAGIGGLMLFWLYWPWSLLTVYSDHAPSPQSGSAGYVTYTVKYCRNSPVPSSVFRTVVGVGNTHYNYPLPVASSSIMNGCGSANITVDVGQPIHPGTYYIKSSVRYQINPLRTLVVNFQSNVFVVTN